MLIVSTQNRFSFPMTNEFKLKHTHYSNPLDTYNLHKSFNYLVEIFRLIEQFNLHYVHNNAIEIACIIVNL